MASSVYSEVTASRFDSDRVLDKLKTAAASLPYTVDDITISHNDFAVADVYNDSIRKLYSNYLYLIANAELLTKTPPTSSAPNYLSINDSMSGLLSAVSIDPTTGTGTNHLSGLQETHLTLKNDGTEKFLYFNYSPDQSVVTETDVNLTTITTLVSGNEVEFNKTFKFKNVVSVDIVDNLLFVLDRDSNTAFKFDITGLITDDNALKRTGVNDTAHPGRYLLKTIGGEGKSQTKNKLVRPSSLSVYKNRIYILDNGHNSIKVFDLDFNFIQEVSSPNLFNNSNTGELVSIVVDQYSDTNELAVGYILSSKGKIIEYNVTNNTLSQPQALFNFYDTRLYTLSGLNESDSFKKIVNSKAVKNILYICNDGKIYKYYKSNLTQSLGVLNLSAGNSGIKISGDLNDQQILSFDTALYNNKDYVAVTTKVNSPNSSDQRVSTYVYEDEHVTTKLYSENLYTNYFTLSDILVLPQEIVNNITFNKTTKKIIYNHYSLFENLNKKVYSFYNTANGLASVPTLCAINYHEFTKPTSLDDSSNLYIGVNEPILTDVINRPLKLLYSQQESLFDLIKEEPLNNNPPDNIAIRLPANTESFPNVISVTADSTTITSGQLVTFTVTRTNVLSGKPSCSFKYYTTLGTALSSDITYISSTDKGIETFKRDELTKTIIIDSVEFFSGVSKTFNFIIEENTNCVVDPSLNAVAMTIEPIGDMYTISMSATTLSINEGSTGRVAVTRHVTADPTARPDVNIESSVNLKIEPSQAALGLYTPVVTGSSTKNVVYNKYADFSTIGPQQDFAENVGSTSTVFFTDIVTSVVFDISAVNDLSEISNNKTLQVIIDNPSDGSIIVTPQQSISLNQEYKTTSLFLSAISASYLTDTTNLLSCVNIWEALSGSTAESNTTAFSTFSATNPYIVNFTVNTPLSVFSVSTVSAALQFDSPTDSMVYDSNQLNVIVEGVGGNVGDASALLMGKAGDGGHGALWISGHDVDRDSGSNPMSASFFSGQAGGPAIDGSTYFSTISVNNSGFVYGGAGGGGGGLLGLSAENDTGLNPGFIESLSAGSGGGGGAGIHAANYGAGGLAGVKYYEDAADVQTANFRHVFVNNGADATIGYGNAGLGGTYSTSTNSTNTYPTIAGTGTTITDHLQISGLSGGNYGLSGQGDTESQYPLDGSNIHATLGPDSSYETGVPDSYKLRAGGPAGDIAKRDQSTSTTQVITAGDGTYAGVVS